MRPLLAAAIFVISSKIQVRASTIFGESEWRVPKETSLSTVAFMRLPSICGRILSRSHWACAAVARRSERAKAMRFMARVLYFRGQSAGRGAQVVFSRTHAFGRERLYFRGQGAGGGAQVVFSRTHAFGRERTKGKGTICALASCVLQGAERRARGAGGVLANARLRPERLYFRGQSAGRGAQVVFSRTHAFGRNDCTSRGQSVGGGARVVLSARTPSAGNEQMARAPSAPRALRSAPYVFLIGIRGAISGGIMIAVRRPFWIGSFV